VAGVRILPAGRLGNGMLLMREEASIGPAVPVRCGAVWDGRFRLTAMKGIPTGAWVGKLGDDTIDFRWGSDLPSAVLRTLPAIRIGGKLASVPHLGYGCEEDEVRVTMLFGPGHPAAGPCFVPIA